MHNSLSTRVFATDQRINQLLVLGSGIILCINKPKTRSLVISERLLAGDLHWQPGAPAVRPHGVHAGGGGHGQQPGPRLGPSPGPAPGLHRHRVHLLDTWVHLLDTWVHLLDTRLLVDLGAWRHVSLAVEAVGSLRADGGRGEDRLAGAGLGARPLLARGRRRLALALRLLLEDALQTLPGLLEAVPGPLPQRHLGRGRAVRSLGLRPPQLVPLGPALGPLLAARRRGLGGLLVRGGGVGRQRGRGLVLSVGGGGVGDTPLPGPRLGPRSSLVRRGGAGGRKTEQLTGVAEDGRGFGLGPPHPRLGGRAALAGRRARVRRGRRGEAVEDARRHRRGGLHLGRLRLRPLSLGLGPRLSLVHRGCWRFGRREGEVAAVVVVVDVEAAGDVDLADVVASGVEAS